MRLPRIIGETVELWRNAASFLGGYAVERPLNDSGTGFSRFQASFSLRRGFTGLRRPGQQASSFGIS